MSVKRVFPLAICLSLGGALAAAAQPVTQPFTFNILQQDLPAVRNATVSWADIDNDGDLDVVVSGRGVSGLTGGIYSNQGASEAGVQFVPLAGGIKGLAYSRSDWADLDGDGDLDLAISGSERIDPPYSPVTLIYRNDGASFTELDAGALPAYHSGALAWSDYDGDGDLDLLVSGVDADGAYRTSLARNTAGTFSIVDSGIPGFAFGEGRWGDYDSDGDPDLLISGATDAGFRTQIFRNSGGTLTDSGADFAAVAFSSVDWGDFDADGDLDVIVGGGQVTPRILEGSAELYRNDSGTFSRVDANLTGTLAGSLTFGDYDNDGDLDILSLGAESALGRRSARIYRNEGAGVFSNTTLLVGAIFASADWGDFDGDGDLDLLASGATSYGEDILNLYENTRQPLPSVLSAPSALRSTVVDSRVTLEWTHQQDGVLTYDVRIGTYAGGSDVRAVPADLVTGFRRVGRPGFHAGATAVLNGLESGTYFWSVQAVGPAFAASDFATEGSFVVAASATDLEADGLIPAEFSLKGAYPNPFGVQTRIGYDVPSAARVQVRVFDILGRQVALLVDGVAAPGSHTTLWQTPGALAGGVYFLEMRAGSFRETRTLTLVR
ncbi:MAG: hypothetical protein ACI80V_001123 [Rhodothermales bacterium]|jgi:hypothetical protein